MEREACVCDHGFERSDSCAEIIIIIISVQYNIGLPPDIILLTQYYYHRGTRLNALKRFCLCSL